MILMKHWPRNVVPPWDSPLSKKKLFITLEQTVYKLAGRRIYTMNGTAEEERDEGLPLASPNTEPTPPSPNPVQMRVISFAVRTALNLMVLNDLSERRSLQYPATWFTL
ncbi:unnamed protein product [Lupinus luteus]|uniref:Uncharacterized protein n=1 Tax=Lupinus luteus TaxID=3873 RepID=A0AAV1Y1C2_LUPLU